MTWTLYPVFWELCCFEKNYEWTLLKFHICSLTKCMEFHKYIRPFDLKILKSRIQDYWKFRNWNPKMLESDQENFDQKKTENPEKVSELFKITKITWAFWNWKLTETFEIGRLTDAKEHKAWKFVKGIPPTYLAIRL